MTEWPPITYRGPPIDEARLRALEETIGATLPDDYRAFMLEYNGGVPEQEVFTFDKRNKSSVNYFNSIDHENQALDLMEAWQVLKPRLPKEVFPIGDDNGGATIAIVVSGPRRGEVWFCTEERPTGSNPRVSWLDRRDAWKVADSFAAFMARLTPRPKDD